jgi:hypothetical protein
MMAYGILCFRIESAVFQASGLALWHVFQEIPTQYIYIESD